MAASTPSIDTSVLDNIIVGRVEPYIYAFSTETVPNYLKVGDTSRGVNVRLEEWRRIFPNLIQQFAHSAQIDDTTFFRDHAVHYFLEYERRRQRLQLDTIEDLPYYSREFFENATTGDLADAISDIHNSYRENSGKYPLYAPDRLALPHTYARTESYPPRENQQEVIDRFKGAVAAGRTDLLLYAVMRFGKSFTSMCCAREIGARFVVIVSAKGDVREEWKKTIESHVDFADYAYLDSDLLRRDPSAIADTLADPNRRVALFLTLQDLQGSAIKRKHEGVFNRSIDLLIIDETHFGVRTPSYGRVLKTQNLRKREIAKELKTLDGFETLDRLEDAVKALDAKIRLHLSGTPYRILMGDEFKKEDIVGFVQFSDIVDARDLWDETHLKEDGCEEWDNPYFGFPQMIRFAFNLNKSSREKLKRLRSEGITHSFAELFRPLSITPESDSDHRQFKHEKEVLDLLEVIDGTKQDAELLGFLDYDRIKKGKMCRHIVCVLPFRASCDAMAQLLRRHKSRFKNLGEYEIINIAGFDDEHKYKSIDSIKEDIRKADDANHKTISLTVNRMLTGVTVPQWDTMLFLKATSSSQEYDQAIFRLQNQYVKDYTGEGGRKVRLNMKPQTLLVDFDPERMFFLQELKSHFYNVNTSSRGNAQLKARIARELEISPIITLNSHKLRQVTATDITKFVREYSSKRSIIDDASDMPFDSGLLNDETIKLTLGSIDPLDFRKGLHIKPHEGDDDNIDLPPNNPNGSESDESPNSSSSPAQTTPSEEADADSLSKRLAAYYARILFFAFLTDSVVKSLEDIIASIPDSDDNRRIARHLGLRLPILSTIFNKSNPNVLRELDYKIEHINDLINDPDLPPLERVEIAMRKFGRMSDAEIITPARVADDVVGLLPDDVFSQGPILDIASKQGEFAAALLRRYGPQAADKIYSVCTSKPAYEFTRKVYRLLSLPVGHIFDSFTSFDLIKKDSHKHYLIPKEIIDMHFAGIIGNPPYQDNLDSSRSLAKQLFPQFIEMGIEVKPPYLSLISPARWFTADAQDNSFPKLREIARTNNHFNTIVTDNGKLLFPDTELGMIDYFLWDRNYIGKVKFVEKANNNISIAHRPLFEDGLDMIIPLNNIVSILHKIRSGNFVSLNKITTGRDAFGLVGKDFEKRSKAKKFANSVAVRCAYEVVRFISRSQVKKGLDILDSYKVFTSKGNGGAGLLTDGKPVAIIGKSFIAEPGTACTDSLIPFGKFATLSEAENLQKYMSTKFLRFCVGILKVSQNLYQNVYAFVPMQDFTAGSDIKWDKSVEEIDAQLYAKYGLSADEISFIEKMIKPM